MLTCGGDSAISIVLPGTIRRIFGHGLIRRIVSKDGTVGSVVSSQATVRREPSSRISTRPRSTSYATSCLLIIQVRWAAMSFSVQRRSMASKPNWTRESRSLPLGTYCTGDFRWVYSIWSRTEGNCWTPHKRNSADFERRGHKCRCLREGAPLERPKERQLQSALTGGAASWLDGIARSM